MKVEILKQNGYRFLWIDGSLWMWDIPVERELQKKIADEAYGNVLVAGYGLGIVQRYLVKNKEVIGLTTVEKNIDVILACEKEYKTLYGTVDCMNFYNVGDNDLRPKPIMKWDCIIGDIWDDIVPEHLEKYKRFKSKAEGLLKPNGKILAWGKDYFEYLIEKEK